MAIIKQLSTITLNASGLNAPNKRDRCLNGLKKKDPCMLPTKDPLHTETRTLTEDKGVEKRYFINMEIKKMRILVIISPMRYFSVCFQVTFILLNNDPKTQEQ